MIYFTADQHFGCDKLVENSRKEFQDCAHHDEALMHNLNSTVGINDRLIIIGDLCREKPGRYRPKIRCKNIMFVLGNHDKEAKIRRVFGGNVRWQYMAKCSENRRVFCAHFAHFSWDRSHYGVYHAYGHWHNNPRLEMMLDAAKGRRSMDVGVDSAKKYLGEYRPFSEGEFFNLLANREGHENIPEGEKWTHRDYTYKSVLEIARDKRERN